MFLNEYFKLLSMIWFEINVMGLSQALSDNMSTLFHVMAWCRQAPSHYLCHCCPGSVTPYTLPRSQCLTHMYVGKLTIIGSDNNLSPGRRQAIIGTNAAILIIEPLETNFTEILNEIQTFSLTKIRLKMSSAKCCQFHLGLNVLSLEWQASSYLFSAWAIVWIGTSSTNRVIDD